MLPPAALRGLLPPAGAAPPSLLLRVAMAMRQTPLTCSGHTRPVVDLAFSGITPYGYFLISACKGEAGRGGGLAGPLPACQASQGCS